ncbi:prolyl-tRNA synthetase, partial [Patescibacteria group bacterium]|nr:prolyl-tRNA synthetase [Patescibacteria group bacterium]
LGTRFSKPFNLQYVDQNGKHKDIIMGCYGFGPSRVMATIVETHNDDKGIIWPEEVAPFKVHLIGIRNKELGIRNQIEKFYQNLQKNNIEVLYDDRDDVRPGEKFADADLIGCPYRIVVSERTLAENSVEIKKRGKEKCEMIKIDDVINYFKK